MYEGKFCFRVGEGHMIKFIDNMPKLGLITFQEFSTGWNIEKEVLYLKISSRWCLNWFLQLNAGSHDANMGAQFLTWPTGL